MSFFIKKLYQVAIIYGLLFLGNYFINFTFAREAIDRFITPKPIGNGQIGNFASNPVSTLSESRCSLEYMDGKSIQLTDGSCFGAQDCFNRNIKLKLTDEGTDGNRVYCVGLGQEQSTGVIYSPGILMICKHPEWKLNRSLELDYYNANIRNIDGKQQKEYDVYDEVNRLNNGEGTSYCRTAGFILQTESIITRQVKIERSLLGEIVETVSEVTSNASKSLAFLVSNIREFWSF